MDAGSRSAVEGFALSFGCLGVSAHHWQLAGLSPGYSGQRKLEGPLKVVRFAQRPQINLSRTPTHANPD